MATACKGKAILIALACLATFAAAAAHAGEKCSNADALRRIANPPLGLPRLGLAKQDEPNSERIALGRKLFFDPRLSGNSSMSCATCHVPEQGFTQNDRATPKGADGRPLRRNAPSLLNVGYEKILMRDGAAPSLQSQILVPLFEPHEMANPTFKSLLDRMQSLPDYQGRFEKVFGAPATVPLIGKAIASYERSLVSANSAFDRWRYGGEPDALGADAQRGFRLFTGRAGCTVCHRIGARDALLTDQAFHNTGIGYRAAQAGAAGFDDRGRQEVTAEPADLHKFKTPTLRNVARTAPYMHDGSLRSLEDVVRYYNGGGSQIQPKTRPFTRWGSPRTKSATSSHFSKASPATISNAWRPKPGTQRTAIEPSSGCMPHAAPRLSSCARRRRSRRRAAGSLRKPFRSAWRSAPAAPWLCELARLQKGLAKILARRGHVGIGREGLCIIAERLVDATEVALRKADHGQHARVVLVADRCKDLQRLFVLTGLGHPIAKRIGVLHVLPRLAHALLPLLAAGLVLAARTRPPSRRPIWAHWQPPAGIRSVRRVQDLREPRSCAVERTTFCICRSPSL